jgi:LmbE family N-acetylglucosaminyl deacetylase
MALIYDIRSRTMPRRSRRKRFRRITDVRDDTDISRVLAIAAHPDDLDFGAAGTIALWTGRGIDVVYCIVTDGDAGGFEAFQVLETA